MSASVNPDIVTDGLVFCIDDKDLMSNGAWKDILLNSQFSGNVYRNSTWANNIDKITICLFVEKVGNSNGYANQFFHKFNSGTTNASFVLYHFHNYLGQYPNEEGRFQWLGTSATWRGISGSTKLDLNEKAFICLQYNSTNGGQMWKNDLKIAGREGGGGGLLANSGSYGDITIINPGGNSVSKLYTANIYSRELRDDEIIQNYKALKGRYGL